MSLTLELTPETDARLRAEASRRGIRPDQLAAELIEVGVPKRPEEITDGEFEALSEALAEMNRGIEPLRPECYDRAYFYEDRI